MTKPAICVCSQCRSPKGSPFGFGSSRSISRGRVDPLCENESCGGAFPLQPGYGPLVGGALRMVALNMLTGRTIRKSRMPGGADAGAI